MTLTYRRVKGVQLTPDEADGNMDHLLLSANHTFVQSGTGAISRTVSQELGETITPFQFGGVGNGVANDSAAILAASVAAVAQGKDVDFGGHTWLLGTQIALTGSHPNLGWRLRGATLKKGFNGDLVTLSHCPNFAIHGVGTLDGQHGTYTGRGIVFSGSGSSTPYFGAGITFTSFTDSHIEFGADSGLYARILCNFQFGSGQSDYRAIYVNGPDTSAIFRFIAHSIANLGYHQLAGANNTFFTGSAFRRVQMDSACAVTEIGDCSWGNTGSAITIIGQNTIVNDCRLAGDVTIDSTFSGSFVGNRQTSGGFTNNSTALVFHYNNTTGQLHICGQISYGYPSATERLLSSRTANVPDSDMTAQVGSSAPTTIFNTVTGARTVTLSTTGAIAGDRFRFINKGASNVSVGGLKTLTGGANNWCDVEFDGSGWVQTGFGAL